MSSMPARRFSVAPCPTFRFTRDGQKLIGVRDGWRQLPAGQQLEVIDARPR